MTRPEWAEKSKIMNIRSKNGATRVQENGNPTDALPKIEYLNKVGSIGKGRLVPVDEIKIDKAGHQGPRFNQLDDVKVSELQTAFAAHDGGFDWADGAIVVAEDENGGLWVVDGRHRTKALRNLKQESIYAFFLTFEGWYADLPFHTALRKAGAKANSHNKPATPNDEPTFAYNLKCDLGLQKDEEACFVGEVTPDSLRRHLQTEYDSDILLTQTRESRIVNTVYKEWEYQNAPADSRIKRYNRSSASSLAQSLDYDNIRTQSYYNKNQAEEVAAHLLTDGDATLMWTKEFSNATSADETMERCVRDTYNEWAALIAGVVEVIKQQNKGNAALDALDLNAPSLQWYLENNNVLAAQQTATTEPGSFATGEGRVKKISINDLPSVKRAKKAA